jgi:putative ABC transport system substrate-binding protein
MKRREAIVGIGLLAAMDRSQAQSSKVPRVGVLHAGSSKESPTIQREPFERGLRELGWMPGSNVLIDYRYAEGNTGRLDELAAALIRSGVDVIVARAPAAINAARRATASIPIVMSAGTDDPVAEGLVKSLSQPGGNHGNTHPDLGTRQEAPRVVEGNLSGN